VFPRSGEAVSVVLHPPFASSSQLGWSGSTQDESRIGPNDFAEDFCKSLNENFGRLGAATHAIGEAMACETLGIAVRLVQPGNIRHHNGGVQGDHTGR
jgi:hypothetical protein